VGKTPQNAIKHGRLIKREAQLLLDIVNPTTSIPGKRLKKKRPVPSYALH
jgi:hypothetical protein